MAWVNLPTQANGVVINAGNWNDVVGDIIQLGGSDGNTHAGNWNVGTAPFAATGTVRLPTGNAVAWRNAGNTGDLQLYPDSADRLVLGGASASWATVGTATSQSGYLYAVINGTTYRIPLWI